MYNKYGKARGETCPPLVPLMDALVMNEYMIIEPKYGY